MASITVIYTDSNKDAKRNLLELLAEHGHIGEEVEILPRAFCIAYNSETNRAIFDVDVSQKLKSSNSIYAICLSTTENLMDLFRLASSNDNIVCVESNVNWQNIKYLTRISEKHSRFLEELEKLENKCMGVDDRNTVRRQQFQQEYEYLQEEIDQLEFVMKGIAIIGSDATYS